MTRKELYNLVWSKPMTHIGKEFGMSDVAIRKHCKKHDIPTPRVGHWTKIAHGKKVRKPPLPTRKRSADAPVNLSARHTAMASDESKQAAAEAQARVDELKTQLSVPRTLPAKPPALIRSIRAALRKTKKDSLGFLTLGSTYCPEISLSKAAMERALRIVCALTTVAEEQGHRLGMEKHSCYWQVQAEVFRFRIYEMKGKTPHEPTARELKDQAYREEQRARHPNWYTTDRKAYRSWDYFASGRLAFHIKDTKYYWGEYPTIEKRWRDRKNQRLEEQLHEIFIWLASATLLAKDKRLAIEERERVEAEKAERQRQAAQRHENAKALKKHINELVDTYSKITHLAAMADFIAQQPGAESWATQRFKEEALTYRAQLLQNYQADHFDYVFNTLQVTEGDDLLIEAL